MKKIFCIAVFHCILVSLAAQAEINSNMRLFQKPEWDGAIIYGPWLSTDVRYQQFDNEGVDSDFLILAPSFATSFENLSRLEVGMRFWLMDTYYDDYEDEFGVSDIDCWGKYQFFKKGRLSLSGGLMFTLPSGDDSILHSRASGEVNFEAFGSARFYASDTIAMIGHVGIRDNSDMRVSLNVEDSPYDLEGEMDGEFQFEFGGGVIFQALENLNILGEINMATEAYEDAGSDFQITGGVEYVINSYVSIKSGIGIGLEDGAPDTEIIAGCVFNF